MKKVIVFDYENSGNIHKYLGHYVVNLKTPANFDLKKFDVMFLADNFNISVNKLLEKTFSGIVFNNTILYNWSFDRVRSYKIMEKIFKDNDNVKILDYKYYKSKEDIDWKGKGVVKPAFSDAGYKNTIIFEDINEIKNQIEDDVIIQEYCDGEEIAFGTLFVNSIPVLPVYVSFEFKRSIGKDMGGNTGQSAEFGFFTFHNYALKIIDDISKYLLRNKINYTGTIDINGGYKEGIFYPYEFTTSRDGYPEILFFLYKQDLESIIYDKKFTNTNLFKYALIIRRDLIEEDNERKSVEFEVKEGSWKFIPETPSYNDKFITNDYHIGIVFKESEKFIIPSYDFNFTIPYFYYTTYTEEIKKKMEIFKWLIK